MRLFAFVACAAACGLSVGVANAETVYAVTRTNRLVAFSSNNPGLLSLDVPITGRIGGEDIHAIDFRPFNGGLYALGEGSNIYQLNTGTGAATLVGNFGVALSGGSFGFDFNPVVDRIRITTAAGQNLRAHPDTGALVLSDAALAYAAGDANAGAVPAINGSAYTNNFHGTASTTLYGIDSALDVLVTQIPPNAGQLNTVGPLGFDTRSTFTGFDISGATGRAFAAFQLEGEDFSGLYRINLATGAASHIGDIGDHLKIRGLAVAIPAPGAAALASLAGLAMIRRRRR